MKVLNANTTLPSQGGVKPVRFLAGTSEDEIPRWALDQIGDHLWAYSEDYDGEIPTNLREIAERFDENPEQVEIADLRTLARAIGLHVGRQGEKSLRTEIAEAFERAGGAESIDLESIDVNE